MRPIARRIVRHRKLVPLLAVVLQDTKALVDQEMPFYILCAVGASLSKLKAIIDEMEERKKQYGSFSGTQEDAEVSARFIMKTAEAVDVPDTGSAGTVQTETEHKNLWSV